MGSAVRKERETVKKIDMTTNILLVIPTYNNVSTLRRVVGRAIATGLKVLVVNDGSTDGGLDTLNGLKMVSRIDFPQNRGKGAAILAASEWAEAHQFSHMITIDADGQHNPDESFLFKRKIEENPSAIIIGNRQFQQEDVPFSSRFGRRFSNFWFRVCSGINLPDTQSGFRAYPVFALRRIDCYSRRYNFEIEIIVRAVWAGLDVNYVNISVNYSLETRESSHFDPLWDNLRISASFTRLVFRNFTPWPHRILMRKDKENSRVGGLSILHPLRSIKILLKENTSPMEITLAAMLGIFLGTLPLIASHSIAIIFFATRLRLNRLIALNISHICAPPLVPALAIEVGYFLRHGHFLTEFNFRTLGYEAHERLFEYFIGSLLVGPLLALLVGLVVYLLIQIYQNLAPLGWKKRNLD